MDRPGRHYLSSCSRFSILDARACLFPRQTRAHCSFTTAAGDPFTSVLAAPPRHKSRAPRRQVIPVALRDAERVDLDVHRERLDPHVDPSAPRLRSNGHAHLGGDVDWRVVGAKVRRDLHLAHFRVSNRTLNESVFAGSTLIRFLLSNPILLMRAREAGPAGIGTGYSNDG